MSTKAKERLTENISIDDGKTRLGGTELDALKKIASDNDRTVSAEIRRAIRAHIERELRT
jgi:hypothetical protein